MGRDQVEPTAAQLRLVSVFTPLFWDCVDQMLHSFSGQPCKSPLSFPKCRHFGDQVACCSALSFLSCKALEGLYRVDRSYPGLMAA
jgi:hypothetical protein